MNHTFELNRNTLALTDSETNGSTNQARSLKDDQQQEMVAIGGCGGVFFVPSRQINDYYQAHGLVSAGLIILFVLYLIGTLFINWKINAVKQSERKKVIFTCAVTGTIHMPTMSDVLPYKPENIARQAIEAAEAGAAIFHLHREIQLIAQCRLIPSTSLAFFHRSRMPLMRLSICRLVVVSPTQSLKG